MSLQENNAYAENLADSILSNSALRDNLVDADAQPLIDWAMAQAERVGLTITDEEDLENKKRPLMRLIKYVARYTARRHEKDQEWAQGILDRLDEYNEGLGEQAASENERAMLLNHADDSNIDLLNKLFSVYGLKDKPEEPSPTPEQPSDHNAVNLGENTDVE